MTKTRNTHEIFEDANKGNIDAFNQLEEMRINPESDNKFLQDLTTFWEKKAAWAGDPDAAYQLGRRYLYGIGEPIDVEIASAWFYYAVKEFAKQSPSSALAFQQIKSLAEGKDGNAKALLDLACCYYYGYVTKKDFNLAAIYMRQAAQKANISAMQNIAAFYRYGYGVVADLTMSAFWYFKAATLGNEKALNNLKILAETDGNLTAMVYLAQCYEKGFSSSIDTKKALLLYRKAAEKKDANALYHLGRMYQNGIEVKQDVIEASAKYLAAAKLYQKNQEGSRLAFEELRKLAQGPLVNTDIFNRLAICYFDGYAVQKDPEQSAIYGLEAYRCSLNEPKCNKMLEKNMLAYLSLLPQSPIRILILMEFYKIHHDSSKELMNQLNTNLAEVISAIMNDQCEKSRLENWELLVRDNRGLPFLSRINQDADCCDNICNKVYELYMQLKPTESYHDREKYCLFLWCLKNNAIERALEVFKLLSPSFNDYRIVDLYLVAESDREKLTYQVFKALVARKQYKHALLFLSNDHRYYDHDVLVCFNRLDAKRNKDLMELETALIDRVLANKADIDPGFLSEIERENDMLSDLATKINVEFYSIINLFDTYWEIRNIKKKDHPLSYFFSDGSTQQGFINELKKAILEGLEGDTIIYSKTQYAELYKKIANIIQAGELDFFGEVYGKVFKMDELKSYLDPVTEIAESFIDAERQLAKIQNLIHALATKEAEEAEEAEDAVNARQAQNLLLENSRLLKEKEFDQSEAFSVTPSAPLYCVPELDQPYLHLYENPERASYAFNPEYLEEIQQRVASLETRLFSEDSTSPKDMGLCTPLVPEILQINSKEKSDAKIEIPEGNSAIKAVDEEPEIPEPLSASVLTSILAPLPSVKPIASAEKINREVSSKELKQENERLAKHRDRFFAAKQPHKPRAQRWVQKSGEGHEKQESCEREVRQERKRVAIPS